jgi:uncharacterized protein (DUF4415 family)
LVRIRFDPDKRRRTLEQRGLDFADAVLVFAGRHTVAPDERRDSSEPSFISVGELHGRLWWSPGRRAGIRDGLLQRGCVMPERLSGGGRSSHKLSGQATTDPQVTDPDEVPELSEEYFKRAALFDGDTLVRRGRPKSAAPKQLTTLRLDPAVIAAFRASGPGWQTRINAVLKAYVRRKRMIGGGLGLRKAGKGAAVPKQHRRLPG